MGFLQSDLNLFWKYYHQRTKTQKFKTTRETLSFEIRASPIYEKQTVHSNLKERILRINFRKGPRERRPQLPQIMT